MSIPAPPRFDLAVVLAAGGSRRMGRPKALLELDGRPLVCAQVDALAALAREVVVVVGAHAGAIRAALPPRVPLVENPAWEGSWPADSARIAALAVPDARSAAVTPVDTPPVAPDVAAALCRAGAPAVPTTPAGHDGHPVVLGAGELRALRRAAPDDGLRALLASAPRIRTADPLVATDFDDPDAWIAFNAAWTVARGRIRGRGDPAG